MDLNCGSCPECLDLHKDKDLKYHKCIFAVCKAKIPLIKLERIKEKPAGYEKSCLPSIEQQKILEKKDPPLNEKKVESKKQFGSTEDSAKNFRRRRCNDCEGCKCILNCKTCKNCLDMIKYGGQGIVKQACIFRKCQYLTRSIHKKLNLVKCSSNGKGAIRSKLLPHFDINLGGSRPKKNGDTKVANESSDCFLKVKTKFRSKGALKFFTNDSGSPKQNLSKNIYQACEVETQSPISEVPLPARSSVSMDEMKLLPQTPVFTDSTLKALEPFKKQFNTEMLPHIGPSNLTGKRSKIADNVHSKKFKCGNTKPNEKKRSSSPVIAPVNSKDMKEERFKEDVNELVVVREPVIKDGPVENSEIMFPRGKHKRFKCTACESCKRPKCGKCVGCKSDKLYSSCLKKKCSQPCLSTRVVCYLCGMDPWLKFLGNLTEPMMQAEIIQTVIRECCMCFKISHSFCSQEKFPSAIGIINESMPNSWECPDCVSSMSCMKANRSAKSRPPSESNKSILDKIPKEIYTSKQKMVSNESTFLERFNLSVEKITARDLNQLEEIPNGLVYEMYKLCQKRNEIDWSTLSECLRILSPDDLTGLTNNVIRSKVEFSLEKRRKLNAGKKLFINPDILVFDELPFFESSVKKSKYGNLTLNRKPKSPQSTKLIKKEQTSSLSTSVMVSNPNNSVISAPKIENKLQKFPLQSISSKIEIDAKELQIPVVDKIPKKRGRPIVDDLPKKEGLPIEDDLPKKRGRPRKQCISSLEMDCNPTPPSYKEDLREKAVKERKRIKVKEQFKANSSNKTLLKTRSNGMKKLHIIQKLKLTDNGRAESNERLHTSSSRDNSFTKKLRPSIKEIENSSINDRNCLRKVRISHSSFPAVRYSSRRSSEIEKYPVGDKSSAMLNETCYSEVGLVNDCNKKQNKYKNSMNSVISSECDDSFRDNKTKCSTAEEKVRRKTGTAEIEHLKTDTKRNPTKSSISTDLKEISKTVKDPKHSDELSKNEDSNKEQKEFDELDNKHKEIDITENETMKGNICKMDANISEKKTNVIGIKDLNINKNSKPTNTQEIKKRKSSSPDRQHKRTRNTEMLTLTLTRESEISWKPKIKGESSKIPDDDCLQIPLAKYNSVLEKQTLNASSEVQTQGSESPKNSNKSFRQRKSRRISDNIERIQKLNTVSNSNAAISTNLIPKSVDKTLLPISESLTNGKSLCDTESSESNTCSPVVLVDPEASTPVPPISNSDKGSKDTEAFTGFIINSTDVKESRKESPPQELNSSPEPQLLDSMSSPDAGSSRLSVYEFTDSNSPLGNSSPEENDFNKKSYEVLEEMYLKTCSQLSKSQLALKKTINCFKKLKLRMIASEDARIEFEKAQEEDKKKSKFIKDMEKHVHHLRTQVGGLSHELHKERLKNSTRKSHRSCQTQTEDPIRESECSDVVPNVLLQQPVQLETMVNNAFSPNVLAVSSHLKELGVPLNNVNEVIRITVEQLTGQKVGRLPLDPDFDIDLDNDLLLSTHDFASKFISSEEVSQVLNESEMTSTSMETSQHPQFFQPDSFNQH